MIAEALDRVKIGVFARMGIPIRGVIHVGANNGYEVEWYLKMGVEHVLCFEPLPSACAELHRKYGDDPRVQIVACALGASHSIQRMTIPEGDGQGSTLLHALRPDIAFGSYPLLAPLWIPVFDFISVKVLLNLDLSHYNCLVVDVQGMELDVLAGFVWHLKAFDCLNIECSREPLYEGEAPAQQVVDFLVTHGFKAITPIESHDDILFVKDTWQTT